MVKTINFPFVIVDKVIDLYLGHLSLSGIVTVLTPVTPVFVSVFVSRGSSLCDTCHTCFRSSFALDLFALMNLVVHAFGPRFACCENN